MTGTAANARYFDGAAPTSRAAHAALVGDALEIRDADGAKLALWPVGSASYLN